MHDCIFRIVQYFNICDWRQKEDEQQFGVSFNPDWMNNEIDLCV